MKLLIILGIVFIVTDGAIAANARNLRMTKDIEKVDGHELADYQSFFSNKLNPKAEIFAEHLSQCVFDKTGITDPERKFNPDAALKLMTSFANGNKYEAAEFLKFCETETNGKNSAWAMFSCIVTGLTGADISSLMNELASLGARNLRMTKDIEQAEQQSDSLTPKQVFAKHAFECLFEKTGITDSEGKFNNDAALKLLSLYGKDERDKGAEVLKKCKTRTNDKTAWAIFNCVFQTLTGKDLYSMFVIDY